MQIRNYTRSGVISTVAVVMSHVIRWSDCNSEQEESSEAINPSSKIRLFREYSEDPLLSHLSRPTPYWKCAVLGLPNELKEEVMSV